MSLPNLARIAAAATTQDRWGPEGLSPVIDAQKALIAAAPDMAALLIECAEALNVYALSPVGAVARGQLARLADFDKGIGA